jgi:hypothetical protein
MVILAYEITLRSNRATQANSKSRRIRTYKFAITKPFKIHTYRIPHFNSGRIDVSEKCRVGAG